MASFFTLKPLQLSSFSHSKHSPTLNTFQFHLPPCDSPKLQATHSETPTYISERSRNDDAGKTEARKSRQWRMEKRPVPKDSTKAQATHSTYTAEDRSTNGTSKTEARKSRQWRTERRPILKDSTKIQATHSKTTTYVAERSTNDDTSKTEARKSRQWRTEKRPILKDKHKKLKNGVREEEDLEKRSRKSKGDVDELRIGLDMCSKRGDVLGAIKLYDLARKEGAKIGLYHYAVLLYLCSSAAAGIVQPAKSGSSTRSLLESATGIVQPAKTGSSARSLLDFGSKIELHTDDDDDDDDNGAAAETVDDLVESMKKNSNNSRNSRYGIEVSEGMKLVALRKGFEIYDEMRVQKVAMNEATLTSVARMAMALGDGDMAFRIVKEMKEHGVNPRLRSYGPALAAFCSNGDVESAFQVEKHMLENGVYPEEAELEALLRVSVEAGKSDRVYYVLHTLRTSVRQVLPSTADLIEKWFRSKVASRVGKRKWDKELIVRAIGDGGGGWHGMGWLGRGRWEVVRTSVGSDGVCRCCGEKLAMVDLDPAETEDFAKSVAAIAAERERNSSFQKFQKWLEYYGPFEAVVDAANVGLYSQRKFKPSKVNAIVNGIRQMLPSRKWPLIVLHNRRITGEKMDEPFNRALIEKWRTADALYATPTGSNDDWYWLYAAIKFRSLIVTNDEMRDHLFQLLGNDFFPKWKERHQVRFSFTETGPTFRMPPPCSVVIQESEEGHWHIPIASEVENEDERIWLCCSRPNSTNQDSSHVKKEGPASHQKKREATFSRPRKQESSTKYHASILPQLEDAEKDGAYVIDFEI